MHVIKQLRRELFGIAIDGRPGRLEDVFPAWHPHDRLGIIVVEPFGAVGASHLMQLAMVAYYEARQSRRDELAQYPEVYVFHVNGRFGDFSAYDMWPARKEVFVSGGPQQVLDALNDRAITRVAVPDRPPVAAALHVKDVNSAVDRMTDAFLYSPVGDVVDGDISICGRDGRSEANVTLTLDRETVLRTVGGERETGRRAAAGGRATPSPKENDAEWLARRRARLDEVDASVRLALTLRRRSAQRRGAVCETYRRVDLMRGLAGLHRA
ncbi:hypothetical protein GTV32_17475 [Gordonia sp. SID5947]|uniref:hypothetical protein n=1 Tax=Gordonia sp. SID5947 TaxID=2690315 RepID=UPI001371C1E6|nr:hypothetical protein [Gordonia sp. SID5947]MYR07977.1 hypothetical protein [Gordonia sp. SID5947]